MPECKHTLTKIGLDTPSVPRHIIFLGALSPPTKLTLSSKRLIPETKAVFERMQPTQRFLLRQVQQHRQKLLSFTRFYVNTSTVFSNPVYTGQAWNKTRSHLVVISGTKWIS